MPNSGISLVISKKKASDENILSNRIVITATGSKQLYGKQIV